MVTIRPREAQIGLDTGSVPNTARDESVGQGLRALGGAIGQAGAAASDFALRMEQQQLQMQEFRTEQEWQRTQRRIAADYDAAKLQIDPSGQGFTEAANKNFIGQYDEFLKTVPEALRPRFIELVATDREARISVAAADEVDQRNRWYEVGVTDTVNAAQTSVVNDPTAFDQRLADVYRTIDATGLPPSKKVALKRQAEEMLGRAWFERTMRDDPTLAKTQLGVGDTGRDQYFAAIKATESGGNPDAKNPRSSATGLYQFTDATWSRLVNAYGDRGLTMDGRKDAAQQEIAIRLLTDENAAALTAAGIPTTNAALYAAHFLGAGSAKTVLKASDNARMADLVSEDVIKANPFLQDMTAGEFRAWAARKSGGGAVASGEPAYQVAALPFNERVKLYDQAVAAEKGLLTAQAAQSSAAYAAEKGALELAIERGQVASEQTILESRMEDDDKAVLLSKWRTRQGQDAAARSIIEAFQAGVAGAANPYDADQRRAVNDAFDLMMQSTAPEQRDALTGEFVRTMGVVPDQLVATVRRDFNGSDVASIAKALQLSAALTDAAPNGVSAAENSRDITEAASIYREMVTNRGMTAEQAAAEVLRSRDPAVKMQTAQLDKAWKEAVKTLSVDDVRAQFDTGIWGWGRPEAGMTPAQSTALAEDYFAAAERAFKGPANGDPALAKTLALDEIKRIYGVSETSGKRVLMKYPPEQFYPVRNGGHGYIRDLAIKDAKGLFPEATNVMLKAIKGTAADVRAGDMPRYNLFAQRPDGLWDMLPDEWGIDPKVVTSLGALDTEEREARFALQRQEQEWRAAHPRVPAAAAGGLGALLQMAGDALTGGGFKPDEDVQRRLQEIQTERVTLLGKDDSKNVMAPSDPLEAERKFLEERAAAYGALGGAPLMGGAPR